MFEDDFRRLSELLYDTDVRMARLDEEVVPYLDDAITFVDPWQKGGGIERYRLGLAGFHSMLRFKLEITQVAVTADDTSGRAIVDCIMHLQPVKLLPSYPLRTILTYQFRRTTGEGVPFKIVAHEEMWSFGDMIKAVPGAGAVYDRVFRQAFALMFLGASYVSARLKSNLPT